jgi:hypothetical protein
VRRLRLETLAGCSSAEGESSKIYDPIQEKAKHKVFVSWILSLSIVKTKEILVLLVLLVLFLLVLVLVCSSCSPCSCSCSSLQYLESILTEFEFDVGDVAEERFIESSNCCKTLGRQDTMIHHSLSRKLSLVRYKLERVSTPSSFLLLLFWLYFFLLSFLLSFSLSFLPSFFLFGFSFTVAPVGNTFDLIPPYQRM